MTREELEEGRRLRALAGSLHIDTIAQARFSRWLFDNSEALLSLAEEARWRDFADEPPGVSRFLGIRAGCIEEYEIEEDGEITWNGGSPVKTEYLPTHWRPLPRGPVKP